MYRINNGADLDINNNDNMNALFLASYNNNHDCLDILIKNTKNIDINNNYFNRISIESRLILMDKVFVFNKSLK